MTFGEKIVYCREEAGFTQKSLAEDLGISPTRLNYWEKDKRQPDVEFIKKLAQTLLVSTDYLLGNEYKYDEDEIVNAAIGMAYSPAEQELIKNYRKLDQFGKRATKAVIKLEAERQIAQIGKHLSGEDREMINPVISLRRYSSPAAAGAPLYAESDYEDVDYPAEIVPDGTSYALGIRGQSMEPEIPDGCTVFVEKTESIHNGDIIIAWIVGEGSVCKRVVMDGDQIVRLESANREFSDISGDDLNGMRVYGKVLSYTTD